MFRRRTSVLIAGTVLGTSALLLIGLAPRFWVAIALLTVWGLVFAFRFPLPHRDCSGA